MVEKLFQVALPEFRHEDDDVIADYGGQLLEPTVFHMPLNFQPSHKNFSFLQNSYVFTEFCGIKYWLVLLFYNSDPGLQSFLP